MSVLLFANNAVSTVASPINTVATSVTIAPGTGAQFPSPGANQYFVATLTDQATGILNEIVWVTAVSGDTLTIQRGKEGTAAQSWNAGDSFAAYVTAGVMDAMLQQGQYQQQGANYAALDIGTVNAIACALSPAPTSLSGLVGAPVRVKVAHTQTSTSITLNVNGLGAVNILTTTGSTVPAGTIVIGGISEFIYDGTNFQYMGNISSGGGGGGVTSITAGAGLTGGTITSSGTFAVDPAPVLTVQGGSDNAKAVTSFSLAGAMAGAHSGSSSAFSGYQKFANGTIIQWGRGISVTGNNEAIAFPIAFPNQVETITNQNYNTGSVICLTNVVINNQLQFNLWTYNWTGTTWAAAGGIYYGWVAIGR